MEIFGSFGLVFLSSIKVTSNLCNNRALIAAQMHTIKKERRITKKV
jgi:hypothetical protein